MGAQGANRGPTEGQPRATEETSSKQENQEKKPRARGTGGAAPETPVSPPPGGTNGRPTGRTQEQDVAYAAENGLCRFCLGMHGRETNAIAGGVCYEHRAVAGPGMQHLFAAPDPPKDLSDAEVLP